jgi:hypothetical protein
MDPTKETNFKLKTWARTALSIVQDATQWNATDPGFPSDEIEDAALLLMPIQHDLPKLEALLQKIAAMPRFNQVS